MSKIIKSLRANAIFAGHEMISETITSAGALSTTLDSIIDTRTSSSFTATLGDATNIDQVKSVKLYDTSCPPATISCSKGSFDLAPDEYEKTLRFTSNGWVIEGSSSLNNTNSFYVTTVQGSALSASGYSGGNPQQGVAVAVAADGNTLASSSTSDGSTLGAVWIFTRSGTSWTQQTKLFPAGYTQFPRMGNAISFSSDGTTVAVGGNGDNNDIGAVWVFTGTGSVWSQQAKLVGSGYSGTFIYQGQSVALSADGNTLALGGYQDNTNVGAAWIFTRTGTSWSQQAKLVGSGFVTPSYQGSSVALSADGNTLISATSSDNSGAGAIWVFTRSYSTWSQQGSKLTVSGATSMGVSVSLSADGNTFVAGAYSISYNTVGQAYTFSRSNNVWSQGPTILPIGASGSPILFGTSVALTADGTTVAIAGPDDPDGLGYGAIWLYVYENQSWVSKIKILGTIEANGFANAISLSADGNTMITGARFYSSDVGAVWVYV